MAATIAGVWPQGPVQGGRDLILVTVGTHGQGFDRLVKAMDELAAGLDEQVVIQRGSSPYEPQHAEHFLFTTSEQMAQLTHAARVIVSHAAAGSILVALRHNKPLIVVPRLRQFGEVLDDHQQQLATALAAAEKVVTVGDPTSRTLRAALGAVTALQGPNEGPAALMLALRQELTGPSAPRRCGTLLMNKKV